MQQRQIEEGRFQQYKPTSANKENHQQATWPYAQSNQRKTNTRKDILMIRAERKEQRRKPSERSMQLQLLL